MLTTSLFLIVWLMGFLFFFSGLGKSQQIRDGVLTVHPEMRRAYGAGLVAYIGLSMFVAFLFVI